MPQSHATLLASVLALLTTSALAQTAPTTTTPTTTPAPADVGHNWWWVILIILLVCGAIWYFRHVHNAPSGAGLTGGTTGPLGVDRDRVAGSAKQAKGSLEEGAGKILGDAKLQAEGRLDQASGLKATEESGMGFPSR